MTRRHIQYRPKLIGLLFKPLLWLKYASYLILHSTWNWWHLKDLELLIQKHPQLFAIANFWPEKVEFKDKRVKFKMCVLVILTWNTGCPKTCLKGQYSPKNATRNKSRVSFENLRKSSFWWALHFFDFDHVGLRNWG